MNIIYTALATALLITGGAGYWYYNHSQDKIANLQQANATLQANNQTLEGEIQAQNANLEHLRTQMQEEQKHILVMQEDLQKARGESAKLRDAFNKHNLEYLSMKKPGLIEKRINTGTENVFKEFETLTNDAK